MDMEVIILLTDINTEETGKKAKDMVEEFGHLKMEWNAGGYGCMTNEMDCLCVMTRIRKSFQKDIIETILKRGKGNQGLGRRK